jgi:hypothetical protein
MLDFLQEIGKGGGRKARLFVTACCRRLWHLLADERSRKGVELLEQHTEGLALQADVRRTIDDANAAWFETDNGSQTACAAAHAAAALLAAPLQSSLEFDTIVSVVLEAQNAPREALDSENPYDERSMEVERRESAAQADILRCIFGNPFRPLPALVPTLLTSNDSLVVKLAQAAYEQRLLPEGHLDPSRLAVLADALEDAGCTNVERLGHLRALGPHWRGCHVLDWLLGKG